MDKVAVVILNYNGQDFLKQFLPTLIQHSSEATIYVADNCSTDDSLTTLKAFPEVKTLLLSENYGYAGGYNEALKQIEAEYYILVNSDIEVTPHWIRPMMEFLDQHEDYAAVQPKILAFDNKDHFEYAGAAGGFIDVLGYPYCRGRILEHLEKDTLQYEDIVDTFWASGACMMVRSKLFHDLGGFDAHFFAHMEEIDLCWRMKSSGYKTACIPQSKVYHVGGGTLNKTNPRKTYLNFRNGISLLVKNLPKHILLIVLPVRIVLDWVASLLFWNQDSFAHCTAVWKAHHHAFRRFRNDLRHKPRSTTKLPMQGFTLIPVSYYLFQKKKYSAINNTK